MDFKHLLLVLVLAGFGFSSVAAQEKVYPKNGEGIILLLKRFDRVGQQYEKQFIELNKGKLGKNNSLIMGVAYTIPPLNKDSKAAPKSTPAKNTAKAGSAKAGSATSTSEARRNHYEPLFGKQYANFPIKSSELKGATFYVVSGHGGPDPGAIGRIGKVELHEDEYAYDIGLRLARELKSRGAKVHILIQDAKDGIRNGQYLNNSKRETCMGSRIPVDQVKRLQQRCYKINQLSNTDPSTYKRAIFLHVDSRNKGKQIDVFFYYQDKNSKSKSLAKTMKSTFTEKYKKNQPGRGFKGTVSKRNLYVLKNTTPTSVFVELGNIQNSFDQQRFILSDNRQALANWLCQGFVTDYQKHKKRK